MRDDEEVPKEHVPKGDVPNEEHVPNSPEDDVPEKDVPNREQVKAILENWIELISLIKDVPLQEFFKKGWKPIVKARSNGKKYIMLRIQYKDPEDNTKWKDTSKSLGVYDSERYEALLSMYPNQDDPNTLYPKTRQISHSSKGSILSATLAKIAPLGSAVHLELDTLQWYKWVQKKAGYPGTLDDFLNQTVDAYFREYQKLELAVIQGED